MQGDSTSGWYSDETATLGDRLAAAREQQGMSQNDLARRLGVRAKTISQWEADASEPRANRVQMLAGLLGVSLRWLLTGEGEGVDGPAIAPADAAPSPISGLLAELRELRGQMSAASTRIGLIEKRLRNALATAE
ncbi:MAG: helix-turn-helix transcriptional regulator [Albidovulum sp.]|jgi:transcriptional regulator with XRE-family HTH domain